MDINFSELKVIAKDFTQKGKSCKSNIDIRNNMYPFSKQFMLYLETLDCYEISSVVLDYGHWEKSRKNSFDSSKKPFRYNQRDIVLVNLGACNYGFEASYKHPCIILENGFNWALVIPCSTGRYSVTNDYIMKAEKSDGFAEKTGIQLDKIRVIDKWRIEGKILGRLSALKFKEINEKLIKLFFPQIEKRIDNLEKKNKIVVDENEQLKHQIEELKKIVNKTID